MGVDAMKGPSWSRIVHDLRGPLMPLRTAAWLLRNELGDSDRTRELADIVDRQSARLARMMDELGEWVRSASGEPLRLDRRPLDAALALDMVIGGIPGCHLEPRYAGESAATRLLVDQHRLDQLLRTMVEHALHRVADRPPEIDVWLDAGHLHVRVRDYGNPLDATARQDLLSYPQSSPFDDGLGLRLLLARRIAEAHDGRLVVEADTDQGLALVCSLPAASA